MIDDIDFQCLGWSQSINKIQKFCFGVCLIVFILGMYTYGGGGKVQRRLCQLESGSRKKTQSIFSNIFFFSTSQNARQDQQILSTERFPLITLVWPGWPSSL